MDIIEGVQCLFNPIQEDEYIDIKIDGPNQEKLERYLKASPVKKKWVNIEVKINEQYQKAKLKFHGTHSPHYQDNKYSYTIKIDKDSGDYINNFKRFKLIKGEEAGPSLAAINALAQDHGLISTAGCMKNVRLNGEDVGHYYFVEDIKKEFLERKVGITNYSTLVNTNDWSRKEAIETSNTHMSDYDLQAAHMEKNKGILAPKALFQYELLCDAIRAKDLDAIKVRFDLDYMAKFLALGALFNDVHFMSGDNLKLVYDFNRGQFFPIYRAETEGRSIPTSLNTFPNFNKLLFQSITPAYNKSLNNQIFKLLLSDNELRNKRDRYLHQMIKNKEVLINTINEYDENSHRVILHSQTGKRLFEVAKEHQLAILNRTLTLGNQYLNYGHIYGSYNKKSKELKIISDAFVPIHITHKIVPFNKKVLGIELDHHLNRVYKYHTFTISEDDFKMKKLVFINTVTGDTISKKHIKLNYIDDSDAVITGSSEEMLLRNNISYSVSDNQLTIEKGSYDINSNVLIEGYLKVIIQGGTTLNIDSAVNFCLKGNVEINGTESSPVHVRNNQEGLAFGTFSIIGENENIQASIDHLNVSGGGFSEFQGRLYTGQFAIYKADVKIRNSSFSNSKGDDGLNVKFSRVVIDSCSFVNNLADQVDLDFCIAKVSNSTFAPSNIDANGDGLDFSGSYALVTNSIYSGFADKGLSLGEKSKVLITGCDFRDNVSGITVKDETKMYAWNNSYENNKFDISAYVKKKIFNAPEMFTSHSEKLNLNGHQLHSLSKNEIETQLELFDAGFNNQISNISLSDKYAIDRLVEGV